MGGASAQKEGASGSPGSCGCSIEPGRTQTCPQLLMLPLLWHKPPSRSLGQAMDLSSTVKKKDARARQSPPPRPSCLQDGHFSVQQGKPPPSSGLWEEEKKEGEPVLFIHLVISTFIGSRDHGYLGCLCLPKRSYSVWPLLGAQGREGG